MSSVPWKDVVAVDHLGDHRLHLRFSDGSEGDIDVASMIEFEGVFAPLKDRDFFAKVGVDPECGTICWPNGADLAPETVYSAAMSARDLQRSKA